MKAGGLITWVASTANWPAAKGGTNAARLVVTPKLSIMSSALRTGKPNELAQSSEAQQVRGPVGTTALVPEQNVVWDCRACHPDGLPRMCC